MAQRLQWLRSNAAGHPPLLFELGMAELGSAIRTPGSNLENVQYKTAQLFRLAAMITSFAGMRTNDSSLQNYDGVLLYKYNDYMLALLKKHNIEPINTETHIATEHKAAVLKELADTLQKFISREYSLPSKTWIIAHGMNSFGRMFGMSASSELGLNDESLIAKIIEKRNKILGLIGKEQQKEYLSPNK